MRFSINIASFGDSDIDGLSGTDSGPAQIIVEPLLLDEPTAIPAVVPAATGH